MNFNKLQQDYTFTGHFKLKVENYKTTTKPIFIIKRKFSHAKAVSYNHRLHHIIHILYEIETKLITITI